MKDKKLEKLPLSLQTQSREDVFINATTWLLIIFLAVYIFLRGIVFVTVYVDGDSMFPTLEDGDYLTGNHLYAVLGIFDRGDIVVVDVGSEVDGQGKKIIKRIIGVEGDQINITNGKVYLNGQLLEEEYLADGTISVMKEYAFPYTVQSGEIFVLGDNREISKDSRSLDYQRIKKSSVYAVVSEWAINNKTKNSGLLNCNG